MTEGKVKPYSERKAIIKFGGILLKEIPEVTDSGCWLARTAASAYSRRSRFPQFNRNGKIPDVTCGNRLCFAPEHVFMRDRIEHPVGYDYRWIREKLWQTEYGGIFDVEVPWVLSARDRTRFRAGLQVGSPHFIMRLLGRGHIRLIRYGDYYDDANEWRKQFPVLTARKVPLWKRPACIYLGMLSISALTKEKNFAHACSVKACVLPANGNGKCAYHAHEFDFPMSMYDRRLDPESLFKPWRELHQTDYCLAAEFPVSTMNLEKSLRIDMKSHKTGEMLKVRSEAHRNAGFELEPATHKEHPFKRPYRKMPQVRNWSLDRPEWKPWIEQAQRKLNFLPPDERTNGAIYEAVVEAAQKPWQLTEECLVEAARLAAADVVPLSHVRVIGEPAVRYVTEKLVSNTQGRGTRGGGGYGRKKIRKKQRMRPAGWHGHHPAHDVEKRWNRETIEAIEHVEDYGNDIDIATLHETGWYE